MKHIPMKLVVLLVLGHFLLVSWIGLNFFHIILSQLEMLYGKGF